MSAECTASPPSEWGHWSRGGWHLRASARSLQWDVRRDGGEWRNVGDRLAARVAPFFGTSLAEMAGQDVPF